MAYLHFLLYLQPPPLCPGETLNYTFTIAIRRLNIVLMENTENKSNIVFFIPDDVLLTDELELLVKVSDTIDVVTLRLVELNYKGD